MLIHSYIGYFKPEKRLHLPISNMENQNNLEDLHHVLGIVDQNIKEIAKAANHIELEGKTNGKVS